ncbi:RAD51-associated protein 1 [Anolis sagrei]|uniref:RAD51-associated protein 1 n=1 Tax=Anolis sagrei TaxID=38937 RepID=UPI00351FEA38
MARPVRRNKKVVDYSQFGDKDDDDDDFASVTVSSKKKSKRECSESKKEKIDQQKQSRKDDIQPQKSQKLSPIETVVLDDKLYKKDMEIALELSVNEPSENSNILQDLQKEDAAGHNPNPSQRKGVLTKSPTQGLRLGLSRLAKVKPLHPRFANI